MDAPAEPDAPTRTSTRTFALVSGGGMVLIAGLLTLVAVLAMRQQDERLGADAARSVVAYAAGPLAQSDLDGPGDNPELASQVDEATAGFGDRLLALTMWSSTGTQVLAVPESVAAADSGRLAEVLSTGRTDVVLRSEPTSVAGGAQQVQVVDAYVPIRASQVSSSVPDAKPTGPVIGVAQVLLDNQETARALNLTISELVATVTAGLALMWLVLVGSAHRATRRLRKVADENARLAYLDPLTGLPNRRMLDDRLAELTEQALRTDTMLGVVVLDVDDFKGVNDTYGHEDGDEVLKGVAARLRAVLRSGDLVARLGGDEFAVLMPDLTSTADANALAHRLVDALQEPLPVAGRNLTVRASFGVACLPVHARDAATLVRRADEAMYQAKSARTGFAVATSTDPLAEPPSD